MTEKQEVNFSRLIAAAMMHPIMPTLLVAPAKNRTTGLDEQLIVRMEMKEGKPRLIKLAVLLDPDVADQTYESPQLEL